MTVGERGGRVLVTGSRAWSDIEAIRFAMIAAWSCMGRPTLVTGGCPTGADAIAEDIARELAWSIERHPANWATYGKKAGPIRNQAMVDLGADICLAFPVGGSRGTRDCVRRARKAGIPVRVWGDGSDARLAELQDKP